MLVGKLDILVGNRLPCGKLGQLGGPLRQLAPNLFKYLGKTLSSVIAHSGSTGPPNQSVNWCNRYDPVLS